MTKATKTIVLFLENRSITDIWGGVAKLLEPDIKCTLLRFNRAFGNKFPGKIIDLAIAPKSPEYLDHNVETFISRVLKTDRAAYLHGATDVEIRCVVIAIFNTLKKMQFNLVIGEVTSVYERAVEFYCKENAIPFLAPMTARIPIDRFFFLDGSSLYPLQIRGVMSKDDLVENAAEEVQRNIGRNDIAISLESQIRLRNIFRALLGWLYGERLHTPSPWHKFIVNLKRKRGNAKLANAPLACVEDIDEDSVVYCMHVQPESTLDTYSPDFWDQGEIIQKIADACRAMRRPFFVRTHPRAKHEYWLHSSKIEIPYVRMLSPLVSMQEMLGRKPTIVTVSGTVLLEAATAGVPTVALDHSYLATFPGVTQITIGNFFKVLNGEINFSIATPESQRDWFKSINRFSHRGLISPPEWSSDAMSNQNLCDIATGVRLAVIWCNNHTKNVTKPN
jgi:hypothetical protein